VTTALVPQTSLGADLVAHLDAQIASARRLLDAVLRQGQAIRARQVEDVLARLTDIQAEMGRRAALEAHRAAILTTAGTALGIPPHTVTLEALSQLLQPVEATAAAERSAQLRGLLAEVTREHTINRALMRQELAFLDHLMRECGGELDTGYAPPANGTGRPTPRAPFRTLDLEA
jgi:FlgN protein